MPVPLPALTVSPAAAIEELWQPKPRLKLSQSAALLREVVLRAHSISGTTFFKGRSDGSIGAIWLSGTMEECGAVDKGYGITG